MKEVELVPEKDPDEKQEKTVTEKIMDKMQTYAKQDIKYGNLVIIVDSKQHTCLDGTAYTADGTEYYCDAEVLETWRRLPEPIVIPNWVPEDMLRGLIT